MSDWSKSYFSKADIVKDLGKELKKIDFDTGGWVESDTDTLYIEHIRVGNKGKYLIYCWNQPNVRGLIAAFLGHPVQHT